MPRPAMRASGSDQFLLCGVGDQVARCLADIDVQAGDAIGVVVVEHQPGALLVAVIVSRLRPSPGFGMSGTFSMLTPLG